MIYRVMVPEDFPGLYELWMSCHGMGLNNVDDTAEGIKRYLLRNPHTSFVCEHEGKIIGAILAGHDGRRGYIYHTAVGEAYRHQGIGHQLVEHALDALLKKGIAKVALVAFETNQQANDFWESEGFTLRTDLSYRNRTLKDMEKTNT